ncbi:hypothetical protein GUITHDRAFT_120639 [Guillardia theta CCMP2712]|uniref:Uncharacterized protein n=1 Tax=Guillardia theta (strain CCMP2712) TaxID=905079 RepID=L1IBH9_GUITC|nr:hypothetical protein GUITHDRAFT_120639 [Guillardia theta CCMP2712]EKX33195.1 hypothetical protein GUITHDRAFT_120639 [Guillardia theta CCMP2712]|eukprot:XP_005820175.1 hypothetical protein GUITHDRAFT_120639 [Guillardia theta CCMP2712]
MRSSLLKALLLLSLRASYTAAVIVRRYEYELKDETRNINYPEGTVEHHCILFADDNSPISVVGTYGRFGYFEGTFQANTRNAMVNWYETATSEDWELVTSSGGAWLIYASNYSSVEGGCNTAGMYDSLDSYVEWISVKGVMKKTSEDPDYRPDFLSNCLLVLPDRKTWQDVMGTEKKDAFFNLAPTSTARDLLPGFDGTIFEGDQACSLHLISSSHAIPSPSLCFATFLPFCSAFLPSSRSLQHTFMLLLMSSQGKISFCKDVYNLQSSYIHIFSEKDQTDTARPGDRETGIFAPNSIAFSGTVGNGVIGQWMAQDGPNMGQTGPFVYLIQPQQGSGPQMIGYYCITNSKKIRLKCFDMLYKYKEKVTCGTCRTGSSSVLLLMVVACCWARGVLAGY